MQPTLTCIAMARSARPTRTASLARGTCPVMLARYQPAPHDRFPENEIRPLYARPVKFRYLGRRRPAS